jgi:alpha-L-fucosidase
LTDFGALAGRSCPDWYKTPQLGIFIHWGIFAAPAFAPRGQSIAELTKTDYDHLFARAPYAEWYSNALRIPESETARHHAGRYGTRTYESFRPEFEQAAAAFDAEAWAQLFAEAGAHYVVFVTKHHDGFCLWPTSVENPRRPGWHASRDFVGELAHAVRRRGLKFGLYYSGGLDWTFLSTPIANLGDMFACVPLDDAYKRYAEAQVRELIARYKPSVLWNDIAWPDEAQLPALFADYYAAVPDGVVNDRWAANVSLFAALHDPAIRKSFNETIKRRIAEADGELESPAPPHCDFRTVEYGSGKTMTDKKWESTRGLGLAFGYNANERTGDYLTGDALIALYEDVASRGGNLLINVGPRADASIPQVQQAPLKALGARLRSA